MLRRTVCRLLRVDAVKRSGSGGRYDPYVYMVQIFTFHYIIWVYGLKFVLFSNDSCKINDVYITTRSLKILHLIN